jgi:MSHA biogenesis protein MshL
MERLYLSHFGLLRAPFSITPDPAFFYAGAGRGELLAGIEYSIRCQEGIVVVTGEVGSGKTMLCRKLLDDLAADIEPLYVANPMLRRRELLATLLRDLGVAPHTNPLDALQEALIARCLAGKRVVLFADEAHVMPHDSLEQIRLLSNLETGQNKLLQIVLFGQPELDQVLARPHMRPLRDRIVERFAVRALGRADVGDYLDFRLAAAGHHGERLFTTGATRALWAAASGLVRRINLLADKSLLSAFLRGRDQVDRRDVTRATRDLDGLTATPARRRANPMARIGMVAAMAGALAACAPALPRPSDSHLQRTAVTAPAQGSIPAAVNRSLDLPPPETRAAPQRFTVVVSGVEAGELLFNLARDAKVNVDVHRDIRGLVTLNAIDQTLVQILDRVATQVDMRYTLEDNLLSVMPDTPFVRFYKVDYLNMSRDSTSRTSIATQVATTGASGSEGGGQGSAGNNSNADLVNTSNNQYWKTLVATLNGLLQEGGKAQPAAAAKPAEPQDKPAAAGEPAKDAAPSAGAGAAAEQSNPNVMAQPETGVVAVRATARQHQRVQEFLDSSLLSARRQVLIEATIAEVELNDAFEQGIDWEAVRTGATDTVGLTLRPGGNVTELPGGAPVGASVPTIGLIELSRAKGQTEISAAVRLLESFGKTRVLSSPKISVLNNQTAMIKVVENLVYFQLTADFTPGTAGSPTTFTVTSTPNTVPVGFLMNVTPQISANDEVVLNLRPTISRLTGFVEDPGVALSLALARQSGAELPDVASRVPEIQTREMESVIKVQDGQIAVLGGLMREEASEGEDAVPGLGRVPFLGNLFKNRTRRGKKSELVIFLRPVVIRDASLQGDYQGFSSLLPDGTFFGAPPSAPAPTGTR